MTPELAAALLVVAVIIVYGSVTFARASRPNLDKAINEALRQPRCSTCQTRPVPIPGGVCGACQPMTICVYWVCGIHGQRLPIGQESCGMCKDEMSVAVQQLENLANRNAL